MKKVNTFLNKFKKRPSLRRRNSTNKRKASPKKGSPAKRKQIRSPSRSPKRNRVSVGDRAGTSGLRNSPRRSISPERSFYPDSLNDSDFYANHPNVFTRDSSKRSSSGGRRSSFGARLQSSLKKFAPRRSQMFKTKGGKQIQLSPIAEGQQIQLSPRAQDALNRVMASRNERPPINNLLSSPNRSLLLPPNSNVANRRQNILSDSVLNLRNQDSFAIRHEKPDFQMEVPSLDTDPTVINEVAMMMREAHLRDDFDINDFAELGFSDYLLNAAMQKSFNLLSKKDKRLISEVQLKKKESLIDKVSKEMAVDLINHSKIVGNKYFNRGIPADVIGKAHKKAVKVKKDLLAIWEKEENDRRKSKIQSRKPLNMRKGYPGSAIQGIYRSPGSTKRKVHAKYTKRQENLKEKLSVQRIVNSLLDAYEQGNFYPDMPLHLQPVQFPSKYVVDPESYAKALDRFKRINALGEYDVDSTPAYTASKKFDILKSPHNDITRSDVLGLRSRRLYHNGGQFSQDEVKKLQKKITDMYEDGDYEEPIVEEQPEEMPGDNFGLNLDNLDNFDQFETEYYGPDSDDDL